MRDESSEHGVLLFTFYCYKARSHYFAIAIAHHRSPEDCVPHEASANPGEVEGHVVESVARSVQHVHGGVSKRLHVPTRDGDVVKGRGLQLAGGGRVVVLGEDSRRRGQEAFFRLALHGAKEFGRGERF